MPAVPRLPAGQIDDVAPCPSTRAAPLAGNLAQHILLSSCPRGLAVSSVLPGSTLNLVDLLPYPAPTAGLFITPSSFVLYTCLQALSSSAQIGVEAKSSFFIKVVPRSRFLLAQSARPQSSRYRCPHGGGRASWQPFPILCRKVITIPAAPRPAGLPSPRLQPLPG